MLALARAMNDKAYHLRERFPDKSDSIALLVAEDLEFRAMCEDYNDSINALRYWTRSKEAQAETRVNEYRDLIRELEEEII
jgi:crotonobetainyl-CoA:carnitine CoA-transferase CaiB-like acyl-CoA transferase